MSGGRSDAETAFPEYHGCPNRPASQRTMSQCWAPGFPMSVDSVPRGYAPSYYSHPENCLLGSRRAPWVKATAIRSMVFVNFVVTFWSGEWGTRGAITEVWPILANLCPAYLQKNLTLPDLHWHFMSAMCLVSPIAEHRQLALSFYALPLWLQKAPPKVTQPPTLFFYFHCQAHLRHLPGLRIGIP